MLIMVSRSEELKCAGVSNVNIENGDEEGEEMAGFLHTCYDIQVSTCSVIEPDCFTVHGGCVINCKRNHKAEQMDRQCKRSISHNCLGIEETYLFSPERDSFFLVKSYPSQVLRYANNYIC